MIHTEFKDIPAGEKQVIVPPIVSMLKMEISDGTTTVQGRMTKDSEDYYPLLGIASNTYDSKLAMNRGIFTVEISGLWDIKITNSGPIKSAKLLY